MCRWNLGMLPLAAPRVKICSNLWGKPGTNLDQNLWKFVELFFHVPEVSTISVMFAVVSAFWGLNWTKSCWHTLSWFLILGAFPRTLRQELGMTDLGMEAQKGPNPFRLPKEALIKYRSASSRLSMIHSRLTPELLEQCTMLSPSITLKESYLDHWTRNLVKRLWLETCSGSETLTRIFLGPVTSTMTLLKNVKGHWKN